MFYRPLIALLLGSSLLSPSAQAWELLGLQPGAARAEVGRVLGERFPAASVLHGSLAPEHRLVSVQPFDETGCPGQPLCTGGWIELDAQDRLLRREAVQAAMRQDLLLGIRQQALHLVGTGCEAQLQQQRAQWQADFGEPSSSTSTRHAGSEFLHQAWGACAEQGLCLMISSGCTADHELETEISLGDFSLRQP